MTEISERRRPFRTRRFALWTLLSGIVFASIWGPGLFGLSPDSMDFSAVLKPPGWRGPDGTVYLLGTDQLGRDLLARSLAGIATSLYVSAGGVVIAGVLGTVIGLFAGYYRGWIDAALMRIAELYLPFPFLILVMVLTVTFSPSANTIILGLGLSAWIVFARVVRGSVLRVASEPYIEAASALGARSGRVVLRHVLPNVTAPILSLVTLELSLFVVAESTLSFLGFGVQPPDVSLGLMIAGGRSYAVSNWWVITVPGIFVACLSIGFHLLATNDS